MSIAYRPHVHQVLLSSLFQNTSIAWICLGVSYHRQLVALPKSQVCMPLSLRDRQNSSEKVLGDHQSRLSLRHGTRSTVISLTIAKNPMQLTCRLSTKDFQHFELQWTSGIRRRKPRRRILKRFCWKLEQTPLSKKREHSLANCRGCFQSYAAVQPSFPVRSLRPKSKENENPFFITADAINTKFPINQTAIKDGPRLYTKH